MSKEIITLKTEEEQELQDRVNALETLILQLQGVI
jgi:hypothetical protein